MKRTLLMSSLVLAIIFGGSLIYKAVHGQTSGGGGGAIAVTATSVKTGTASSTDNAIELTIPSSTVTASYTTSGSYSVYPICARPAVIGAPSKDSALSGIGMNWAANGTLPSTWTVTVTVGATQGTSTTLDLVCIPRV